MEASISWIGWSIGSFARARYLRICSRQPGLEVTSTSAPAPRMLSALRRPARSRRLGLDQVVDPRRPAADLRLRHLGDLHARDGAQHAPGLGADSLRVPEVAGVVVDDPRLDRVAAGAGVGDARRPSRRCRGPWRRMRTPAPPTPGRRGAAGRTPSLTTRSRRRWRRSCRPRRARSRRSAARPRAGLRLAARVLAERPAARLLARRDDVPALGGEHPDGGRVDVAKKTRCTQPVSRPTRPPARRRPRG